MNWIWGIMLAFLIACSQAPEPTVAPTSYVVFSGCEATQSIGEKCTQNCDCLKPADCIKGTCSLTKQKDGELCVDNKQCISGYCTETGRCGVQTQKQQYTNANANAGHTTMKTATQYADNFIN